MEARLGVDEAAPARGACSQEHGEGRRTHGHHGQRGRQESGARALSGGECQPEGHEGHRQLVEHDTEPEEEAHEDRARDEQEAENHRGLSGAVYDDQGGDRARPVEAEQSTRVRSNAVDRQEQDPEAEGGDPDGRSHLGTSATGCPDPAHDGEAHHARPEEHAQHGQRAEQLDRTAEREPRPDAGKPPRSGAGVDGPRAGRPLDGGFEIVPTPP